MSEDKLEEPKTPIDKEEDEKQGADEHTDHQSLIVDNNPRPGVSLWKRLALVVCFALLFYFGLRSLQLRKHKVIHASRYSKEFKFRPAASPIITETLKDGRVRLRGALPTPPPKPTSSGSSSPSERKKRGRRAREGGADVKFGRAGNGKGGGRRRRRKEPVVAKL